MKASELLILGRAKLAVPGGFTQVVSARDSSGKPVGYWTEEACAFCSMGALSVTVLEVSGQTFDKAAVEYRYAYSTAIFLLDNAVVNYTKDLGLVSRYRWNIIDFSDTNGVDEVLKVWDIAIELAKGVDGSETIS